MMGRGKCPKRRKSEGGMEGAYNQHLWYAALLGAISFVLFSVGYQMVLSVI